MASANVAEFEKLLYSLSERKPPGTSASKIRELTKIALTSLQDYPHIVAIVQAFVHHCTPEYKLGGLYVLDSISQAAVRGKLGEDEGTAWAVGYLTSFQPLLAELFASIMQCPDKDKEKVKKVLELWIKKGDVYDPAVLNNIKLTCFFENVTDHNGNGMYATGIPPNGITNKPATKISSRDPRLQLNTSATADTAVTAPKLDSSALLATLNSLTQGNLKIPSSLSTALASLPPAGTPAATVPSLPPDVNATSAAVPPVATSNTQQQVGADQLGTLARQLFPPPTQAAAPAAPPPGGSWGTVPPSASIPPPGSVMPPPPSDQQQGQIASFPPAWGGPPPSAPAGSPFPPPGPPAGPIESHLSGPPAGMATPPPGHSMPPPPPPPGPPGLPIGPPVDANGSMVFED